MYGNESNELSCHYFLAEKQNEHFFMCVTGRVPWL